MDNIPLTINQMLEESVVRNFEVEYDDEGVRIGGDGWGKALAIIKEKQSIRRNCLDVELTKMELQSNNCTVLPADSYKIVNGKYMIPDLDIFLYRLQLIGVSRHVEEIFFNEEQIKQIETRHLDLSVVEQITKFNDFKFRNENIIAIVFPQVLFGDSDSFDFNKNCEAALHADDSGSIVVIFDNPSHELFVTISALKVEITRPITPGLYVTNGGESRNLLCVADDTYMFFRDTDNKMRPAYAEYDMRRSVWCKQSGRWFFLNRDIIQFK